MTITTTSCPARWKARHSVSLLIVQVPVQTERLNPKGTNPARKKSLIVRPVPSRPVYAYIVYTHRHTRTHPTSFCTCSCPHTDAHTAWQRGDLTFECGTGSFCLPRISTGECSALSPFYPLATLHSCALVRSRRPEKRRATKIIKSASFRSVCTSRIWPWARSLSISHLISNPFRDSRVLSSLSLFIFYI